ncbi:unnamed protein product [Pocillopora meandrina]|uniref:Uncharacterized protein n=1 Tax=Pocillopora meandrina TaxID=46732 RepID=A0AAU9XB42_9CNID|nr:unnamed protein product [Pocillopora meandrina]
MKHEKNFENLKQQLGLLRKEVQRQTGECSTGHHSELPYSVTKTTSCDKTDHGSHLKKTLHQCVICKKLERLPYKAPKKADLSKTRVTNISLHSHTWELILPTHYLQRPPEAQPKLTSACLHVLHSE